MTLPIRSRLFNHLVAPLAGGTVLPDQARQMLDDFAAESAADERRARLALLAALLDLHPRTEDPRHGCCAAPKICRGHAPECRSRDHALGGVPWPCATLRAAGITTDAEAAAVRDQMQGAETGR